MDQLEAGWELDALVAEKVMGCQSVHEVEPGLWRDEIGRIPRFSTDIAAAWQVVEKLRQSRICLDVTTRLESYYVSANLVDDAAGEFRSGYFSKRIADGIADTAPLAICRAALAAQSRQKIDPNRQG